MLTLLKQFGNGTFYHNILVKAINKNREYERIERKHGYLPPKDYPLIEHLRTAMSAIGCGISIQNWNCVAEGLVLLAEIHERLKE